MHQYVLKLAYLGTSFNGWQSQADGSGIQDTVEKVLRQIRVLDSEQRLTGSSRTDSGVHAIDQCAGFFSNDEINLVKAKESINALLPKDICVFEIKKVELDFHPIKSALSKVYCYRIWHWNNHNPFLEPVCWHNSIVSCFDPNIIDANLNAIIGQHDFVAFCASDSSAKTTVRTIHEAKFLKTPTHMEFWFHGSGFLKQMIRSIVGTLVDVARGKVDLSINEIIESKNRRNVGVTAPAKGLMLSRIYFDKIGSIAEAKEFSAGWFGS